MAPKLRVSISTSQAYPPSSSCSVNSPKPADIKTPNFEGSISVWVKDYHGEHEGGDGHEYFDVRKDMTYAIVVNGRFLDEVDSDDILFGNVFEHPIKDHLPWGTSIATKFMYFIDPTLELDIYADKPWALSPTLASMNYLSLSSFPPDESSTVKENSLEFVRSKSTGDGPAPADTSDEKTEVAARRKWFGSKENRKGLNIDKDVHVGMEFANGLLDFNTLSATLPQPFHLSIPLLKYWDGQPVTYVCRRRPKPGQSPVDKEGMYFSVAFEIVDEGAKAELVEKGGEVRPLAAGEQGGEGVDVQGEDVD